MNPVMVPGPPSPPPPQPPGPTPPPRPPGPGRRAPIVRFMAKVEVQPDGCWRWIGCILAESGYAQFGVNGRAKSAHRWSYEHFMGPIPAGYVIDHQCHNRDGACVGGPACLHRRCVNPEHLEAVPQKVNIARGQTAQFQVRRTHCPYGHPYSEGNTYRYGNKRQCKTCTARRYREWRERHAAKVSPVGSAAGCTALSRPGTTTAAAGPRGTAADGMPTASQRAGRRQEEVVGRHVTPGGAA